MDATPKGESGESFKLTSVGNYDMQRKVLTLLWKMKRQANLFR